MQATEIAFYLTVNSIDSSVYTLHHPHVFILRCISFIVDVTAFNLRIAFYRHCGYDKFMFLNTQY